MRKAHCSARSALPVRYHEIERLSREAALFPLAEYWWLYLAFTGLVAILLAIDLLSIARSVPSRFAMRLPGPRCGSRWLWASVTSSICLPPRAIPRRLAGSSVWNFWPDTWWRNRSRWTTCSCLSWCSATSRSRCGISTRCCSTAWWAPWFFAESSSRRERRWSASSG